MSGNSANFNKVPSGDIVSWVVVIICLAAFWPLGLYLLFKKISSGTKNWKGADSRPGAGYEYKPPAYGQYGQAWKSSPGYHAQGQQNSWQRSGQQRPGPQQPGKTGATAAPYQAYGQGGAPAVRQPAAGGTSKQPYYASDQQRAKQGDTQRAKSRNAKKQDKRQNPAKNLAVALTVLGIILGIMGAVFLSSGLSALAVAGLAASNLAMVIFGAFSLFGALISAIMRGGVLRRIRRFSKYAAVICDREVVSVEEIARTTGEPVKKTRKWLQAMLDSGFYGDGAYIDSGFDSFVISREAAERAASAEKVKTAADSEKEKTASAENQYVTIVNELHMLCSQTSDPAICNKIERIEALTVKIFKIVEENPEKSPQIRRFLNYYLPTTLKLLHSYQTLERQGIGGENITSAKQDIERILDTLAAGFEQQLDNLFKADKLDISADIDVIESLMEQDGLKNDGGIMRVAGGN